MGTIIRTGKRVTTITMCKRIKMGITTGLTMTISITTRIITLKEQ
jgi:hypothetical protein